MEPKYLGDGVYLRFDGYQVWLYTSNGLTTTNEIALEPQVIINLVNALSELPREIRP